MPKQNTQMFGHLICRPGDPEAGAACVIQNKSNHTKTETKEDEEEKTSCVFSSS